MCFTSREKRTSFERIYRYDQAMNELWNRLKSWLSANAPELLADLRPGATSDELDELEAHLGVELPIDLREFLQLVNGLPSNVSYEFYWGNLCSVEGIIDAWDCHIQEWLEESAENPEYESIPGIKDGWVNSRWIPVVEQDGPNFLCVDLDPTPDGTLGQVISVYHDADDHSIEASSFGDWLEQVVDRLESGEIFFSKKWKRLMDEDNALYEEAE
jgi:cell wall assembly regulator SMI1